MKRRTRPPVKQDSIVSHVRASILEGRLRAGDRLPPRSAYEHEFDASSVTVQRAFDRLSSDGFIQVRGNDGTYVSSRPPHLHRYAIAFPRAFGGEAWTQWFTSLLQAAAGIEGEGSHKLPAYMIVDDNVRSEDYRDLVRDIRDHCVAGIVFVGNPRLTPDNPLLQIPAFPRVILGSSPKAMRGCIRVDLGGTEGFTRRAVHHLAIKGRRRIAMLCVGGIEQERIDCFRQAVAEASMRTEPYWIQGVEVAHAKWAANIAHLMFAESQNERPDGVILSDDNIVEHASRGIVQAGVRLPESLDIVAHCNFPARAPSVLPLARLGYNMREALDMCLRLIDARNRGEEVPDYTIVPPRFEV